MPVDQDSVLQVLRTVLYPGFSRDLVEAGVVAGVKTSSGEVVVDLSTGAAPSSIVRQIEAEVRQALEAVEGITAVRLRVLGEGAGDSSLKVVAAPKPSVASAGSMDPGLIPGVKHTIAVASGKGGVGKSTVAVNLALALARTGASVGLLDADIYGPSIPLMLGVSKEKAHIDPERQRIVPFERFGIRFMSIGFFLEAETAAIWRGPMVMKAIQQLLGDVEWGELDYLIVDMPPGTGDAQLTLSQRVQLAGSIIVTTPQDVALADAIRGIAMFRKVSVPVLGLIENMSFFHCPHCKERTDVFGHGGGAAQAARMDVPFLGEIPLDAAVRQSGDDGEPVVASDPDSAIAGAFLELARKIRERLDTDTTTMGSDSGPGWFEKLRGR